MITDQPTETASAERNARTAFASLTAFLDEYPQFDTEPLSWMVRSGAVYVDTHYLHPDGERIVADLATALHATVRKGRVEKQDAPDVRSFACDAVFDGTRWSVAGFVRFAPEDGETGSAEAA
ncbi:hypothetical protein [Streptacidiphilus sp. MAP5-3]|uniref:hypothetical protein n=1 Tax=unclassified Streptacidiphilus TaxID=2643834 RepID=UPI0035169988